MSKAHGSVNLIPGDKVVAWGNPWHGVMAADGSFSVPDGPAFAGQKPFHNDAKTLVDFSRAHNLVMFDVPDTPARIPEEISAGINFKNYAILVGNCRQYSPKSRFAFGERTWLYRTNSGTTWCLRVGCVSPVANVCARRVDSFDPAWTEVATLGGIEYVDDVVFRPDGSESTAAAAVVASSTPARLVCSVAGGDETTPPEVTMSVSLFPDRAVFDDGITSIRETFSGVIYRSDGTRLELWLGLELTAFGRFSDSRRLWYYIGDVRFEAGSVTVDQDAPQNSKIKIVALNGRVDFIGENYDGNGWIGLSASARGVTISVKLPDRVEYFWRGVYGAAELNFTRAPNTGINVDFVEHPLTGEVLYGRWIW